MKFTNTLSEEYLIGAALIDPDTNVLRLRGEGITADFFTLPEHRRAWGLINQFFDNGRVHSIEMMEFEPDVNGAHDGRELSARISEIRSKSLGTAHVDQHVRTLRGFKSLRMLHKASTDALAAIESGGEAEGVIGQLQDAAQEASLTLNSAKPWKTSDEVVAEIVSIVEKGQNPDERTGVSSGIDVIDKHTGGLDAEQLWVVAAPSSCGKTMLMMQFAESFLSQGKHVLAFSFETSAGKLGLRVLSNSATINGKALLGRDGSKLTKEELRRAKKRIQKMKESANFTISDNFDLTLESMMAIATMRAKLGFPIDLILVDYAQLVSLACPKGKTREQEVAEVTRNLKKMAKQHQCPVVTASQLNEEGKTRESRAIVQDADVLLTIDPVEECIYFGKNRDGERGARANLRMNGAYQRFEEYHPT